MAFYGNNSYRLGPTGSKIVLAVFTVFLGYMSADTYFKYQSLSSGGKETTATVVSYVPYVTHSRNGYTTHHYHMLAYDGITSRVELFRRINPGTSIRILYLPDKPSIAAEGRKGMSAFELMGGGNALMIALFGGFAAFFILMLSGMITMQRPQYPDGFAQTGAEPVMQDLAGKAGQDTAVPFQPGPPRPAGDKVIPQQVDEPAPPGTVMPGYDSAAAVIFAQAKEAAATDENSAADMLKNKDASLSDGQAKQARDRARAMFAAAEEMSDDISDGLYTREQAINTLMKSNPGFSEQSYRSAVDKATEQV